jgi:cyclophilin family peptidyl-prolyl cis-trans isomerase
MGQQTKRITGLVVSSVILLAGIAAYYYFNYAAPSTNEPQLNKGDTAAGPAANAALEKALEVDQDGLSKAVAVIQTTRGKIRFRFYTNDAPKTVHRIAELIEKGFYNGLTFHRVVPGFVIQGGDPSGTGAGGSGQNLPAEFNARKHVPGTVAMARAQDPNSADSQFYIALGTLPNLDNQYTVFGQLIEGQDVANQIQVGDRMTTVSIEK